MIAILFVFMVAAAATLTSEAPTSTALPPKPAPVVFEKTIIIECVPLTGSERLERDLTAPFEQRHYINPQGDGCHKKSEAIISASLTKGAEREQHSLKDERKP